MPKISIVLPGCCVVSAVIMNDCWITGPQSSSFIISAGNVPPYCIVVPSAKVKTVAPLTVKIVALLEVINAILVGSALKLVLTGPVVFHAVVCQRSILAIRKSDTHTVAPYFGIRNTSIAVTLQLLLALQ